MPKPINTRHKHICFSDAMDHGRAPGSHLREDRPRRREAPHIGDDKCDLASHYRKKKSMFGADPWLRKARRDDLRDEDDRDI